MIGSISPVINIKVLNNEKLYSCFHSRLPKPCCFFPQNNTIMCSEVLITRKKILKYNFILYPSLYQIDRDTKTVYKNKHQ